MKKLAFIFILLLSSNMNPQSPVSVTKDPFNLAINKLLKQINQKNLLTNIASKEKLVSMMKIYEKWNKNIKIVNNLIKTSQEVIDIKNTSIRVGERYNRYVREISSEPLLSSKDKKDVISYYTTILNDGIKELGAFNKIVGDGLVMNDYERLTLLKGIKKKLEYQSGLLNYFNRKIKSQLRKNKEKLKNREFFDLKL